VRAQEAKAQTACHGRAALCFGIFSKELKKNYIGTLWAAVKSGCR